MKHKLILITILLVFYHKVVGQDTVRLALNEILNIAREQSLDAFRAENMYLASYWEYQSYKAGLLPHASLRLEPSTFNRRMTQRYDFENNVDIYREQQTLDSYANLSLRQNIAPTGGEIYIDSDFGRLVNIGGEEDITTYSATPIRIGIAQPLFGFNEFKWQRKISPVKYEKAKQQFIQDQQAINLKAVNLYFDLLLAIKKKEIAEQNLKTSRQLYEIGKKRFEIASIEKEELLDLELTRYNSEIELTQAEKEIQKARFNLNAFLGRDEDAIIVPDIPEMPEDLTVAVNEAVTHAINYNPEIIGYQQTRLEANRDLEETIKENRFDLDLRASYGLNQRSDQFSDVYSDLLDQQMIMLTMQIPILDWGESKGRREMAQRRKEVAEIEIKQERINFEQEVSLKAIDFNLQEKQIISARKASEIALESYELTRKRFRLGQADVLKLNTAMKASQSAREKYINSLYTYWQYYYELQQLTLYDFRNDKPLSENFDELVN